MSHVVTLKLTPAERELLERYIVRHRHLTYSQGLREALRVVSRIDGAPQTLLDRAKRERAECRTNKTARVVVIDRNSVKEAREGALG